MLQASSQKLIWLKASNCAAAWNTVSLVWQWFRNSKFRIIWSDNSEQTRKSLEVLFLANEEQLKNMGTCVKFRRYICRSRVMILHFFVQDHNPLEKELYRRNIYVAVLSSLTLQLWQTQNSQQFQKRHSANYFILWNVSFLWLSAKLKRLSHQGKYYFSKYQIAYFSDSL